MIADDATCQMAAAKHFEAATVVESRMGNEGGRELDSFVDVAEIELVPVTPYHAQATRLAWRRYGKGNHAAGLNFGDYFAYALAEATREPLLFKCEDFTLTDIELV